MSTLGLAAWRSAQVYPPLLHYNRLPQFVAHRKDPFCNCCFSHCGKTPATRPPLMGLGQAGTQLGRRLSCAEQMGTWCLAPCSGVKTGAPRHTLCGRPCIALECGAFGHCPTSRGRGHYPTCSSPPIWPHSQREPDLRPDPPTSLAAPSGRAVTRPVGHRGEKGKGAAEEPY